MGGSAFQIEREDDKNWFVRWSRKEKLICLHCMSSYRQETVSKLVFLEVRTPTMHTCTSLWFMGKTAIKGLMSRYGTQLEAL